MGNAVQHGAEGPVDDASPDEIAIAVHNYGSIPPDTQVSIFEPCRRERISEAHRSKSIGLGLFIANEIVKALHGTISLTSNPEMGNTFALVIPRRRPPRDGELH